MRAKRLRRADPSEHEDGDAMQLVTAGIDDEAVFKDLEDRIVAAVHNLKNLYFLAFHLNFSFRRFVNFS